ncbi:hypothetical protein Cni_G19889 [Canna indica]|uniref:Uncharacterized protein n=1 Tax=Canna indica TaxID=4628 RepID=A0AAQ3QJ17_9LILI|nr:hypothetical protein Cni_G19889 [Canna indica]
MRDFANGCFGDAAVSVAGDSSARGRRQPLLNSVSCFYRATLASTGKEPSDDFYLILMADGELILLLGDKCGDFIKMLSNEVPVAEFLMYYRKERVRVGAGVQYSTKARFCDGGRDHEVSIVCRGNKCDAKNAELCICVNKKRLVQVKIIAWNFRGNQTVLVDESTVDVLWDVHNR